MYFFVFFHFCSGDLSAVQYNNGQSWRCNFLFFYTAQRALSICPGWFYHLKHGAPSANTSVKFKCGEMQLSFYGDLDGAVWSWVFLFIYSVTIEPLSCITELMHCDSLKLFLSPFSIVLRNHS